MKKRLLGLVGVAFAALVGWRILAAQEQATPGFEIVLEVTGNGWEATCHHGCNWERLKLVCPEGIQCRSVLDEAGIQPPKD